MSTLRDSSSGQDQQIAGLDAEAIENSPGLARGKSCRFCRAPLSHLLIDLGMSPLCESFLTAAQLDAREPFYPLQVYVCGECFLAQLGQYVSAADIFSEYAYFSSYSDSWLAHARNYVEKTIARFDLTRASQVVELASNDGYLLQYFVAAGIPALGVEPAGNVARRAIERGVPTVVEFFGRAVAQSLVARGQAADLVVANNVLAQVPDLNDFVAGAQVLLKPHGVMTAEFPHLLQTIEQNQFDQIYHEHFSYFSFTTIERVFAAHGLILFDVQELPTHGGSLRIFARHAHADERPTEDSVHELRAREEAAGVTKLDRYDRFAEQVRAVKRDLLAFLIAAKRAGKSIVGYGAPGKGNTLLNYCGIRGDFLDYTVDRSTYKQGKFLPGTHIPIFAPERIHETRPDYVLILPWNLRAEITSQLEYIRGWGGRFVIPIPELCVC